MHIIVPALSVSLVIVLVLCLAQAADSGVPVPAASRPASGPVASAPTNQWVDISDPLERKLIADGKKIGWPGKGSAGVGVDPATGDVYLVMSDLGIWRSTDRGATFQRYDDGSATGRCESGYSLQFDPASAGRRMAYIGIWGSSTMTLDGGKTWLRIKDAPARMAVLSVDWSGPEANTLATIVTHSTNTCYVTGDRGQTWTKLGDYNGIGLFDSKTIVATPDAGGIVRSADGGRTWEEVSKLTPTGRAMLIFRDKGYWISKEGLLVSKDKGKTWEVLGKPVDARWGPYFGRDEKHFAVVTPDGFMTTSDAGQTWTLAAPLPNEYWKKRIRDLAKADKANFGQGWFVTFGWDSVADTFYISEMGHPTYRYQRAP